MNALSAFVQKLWLRLRLFKSQGQGHRVKTFGTNRKVLPQGIHTCNIKAPSLLVQKLSFFKSRSKFKVNVTRSKVLVWTERSCPKYIPVLSKPYLFWFKVKARVKFFSKVGQKSR